MKWIRFTPLNILSAALMAGICYLLLFADDTGWRMLGAVPMLLMLLLSAVADLLFRLKLRSLKRIWIVESIFLIFVLFILFIISRF